MRSARFLSWCLSLPMVGLVVVLQSPAVAADGRQHTSTKVIRGGQLETQPGISWMNRKGVIELISAKEYQRRTGTRYFQTVKVPGKWRELPIDEEYHKKHGCLMAPTIVEGDPQYRAAVDAVEKGATAPVYIKRVNRRVGRGLFAADAIRAGDVIGAYAGVVKSRGESRDSDYAWTLSTLVGKPGTNPKEPWGRAWWIATVDGSNGNYLRFVNHSPPKQNVELNYFFHQGMWHAMYRATRDIQKGSQLLTDYGPSYFMARQGVETELAQ